MDFWISGVFLRELVMSGNKAGNLEILQRRKWIELVRNEQVGMGGGTKVAIFASNLRENLQFLKLAEVVKDKKIFMEECIIIWCNFLVDFVENKR